MTQLSRRSFLNGVIACSAAVAIAKLPSFIPRIWGDGVHDDAPGLNAMLSGQPFESVQSSLDTIVARDATGVLMQGGTFLVMSPIEFERSAVVHDCRFKFVGDGPYFIRASNDSVVEISHTEFFDWRLSLPRGVAGDWELQHVKLPGGGSELNYVCSARGRKDEVFAWANP